MNQSIAAVVHVNKLLPH